MANYQMRTLNDLRGDGKHARYPKLVHTGTTSLQSVAEQIHARTTFSVGEIKGLLAALSEVVAEAMADGRSVHLNDLGTFRATLMLAKGIAPEEETQSRHTAPSVRIRSVSFRPSRQLIGLTQQSAHLHRIPTTTPLVVTTDREQRLTMALAYIQAHSFLRVADYCALTQLSRKKATLELNTFAHEQFLSSRGRGSHKVFVAPTA